MITAFDVYLVNILPAISRACAVASIFLLSVSVVGYIILHEVEDEERIIKLIFRCFIASVFTLIISIFIPDKQTMIEMYIFPKVANNQNVQSISENTLKLVDKEINGYLKDVSGSKDDKSDN